MALETGRNEIGRIKAVQCHVEDDYRRPIGVEAGRALGEDGARGKRTVLVSW